ncbi:CoA-binding protein [Candidatus Woesearchaeota archaeon]|nr:CoA-binding protein [Candidatus Woesearchaeota archaeon]
MAKKEAGLEKFFYPKSVAIIGVSANPKKLGHVIFRNFLDGKFSGKYFLVNPNEKNILGQTCYPNIHDIPEKVDLAIIATPALTVLEVIEDCAKKGVKHAVIISAGFEEVGNFLLRDRLKSKLNKHGIKVIGPNCLGVYDSSSLLDTLFLPPQRLERPKIGEIAFLCQSGSAGAALIDLSSENGFGFSKFISYGNAINVDETDLIEYLGSDPKTKVICLFSEGVKDGKKFMRVARAASKKKPILVMKGGMTAEGSRAILSHTGALAGDPEIYKGAFRQAGLLQVECIEELFQIAHLLQTSVRPKGNRVQVITNGGGFGVLATDAIIKNGLRIAVMDESTRKKLTKKFTNIAVVKNPIDLTGNGTTQWFKEAIDAAIRDRSIDIILAITLYQAPLLGQDIAEVLIKAHDVKKKPIIVVATGQEFRKTIKPKLEKNGVPVYEFPEKAVLAIKYLVDYYSLNS